MKISGDAIVTRGLSKRYGSVAALVDLDLTVPPGVIYGFLGPNGAGKTTTLRLLMGFVRPTSGDAAIFGHDVWRDGVAARREVGYLVSADALYPDLSGEAQLDYAANLSGQPPILRDRLLDALELSRADLRRKLGAYSKGMRQKLALTAAIQNDPALLILDEPSDGLDPLIQRAFECLLGEARDRGRTIFMSSHDLAEVERMCERVAIVREGRLVAEERIAELRRRHRRIAHIAFAGPVPPALANVPGCTVVARDGHWVEAAVDGEIRPLLAFLATQPVADLTLAPPSLDDIFMGFYDGAAPEAAEPTATGLAAR
ncbi:MAG TPA: ABC transporter ATP-binding protein [Thermomicrobiales bacterium]|jgi:ABC-2 type transport system ATP-binding protein|nr:ABC transporter ATP-binding protein [Thermomicrobiales bacterium]